MKATVKYNNVFVTSAYDIETLKKVKKFRPEALVLYKGEGKEKGACLRYRCQRFCFCQ